MAVYTDVASSTSVTFKLLLASPGVDGSAAIDDRHIPGGDNNFVDVGGQMLGTWEAEGMFDSYADFQTMLGLANGRGQGTLVYTEDVTSVGITTLQVVLKKVARSKVTGRGQNFAKLSLLIVG